MRTLAADYPRRTADTLTGPRPRLRLEERPPPAAPPERGQADEPPKDAA